MPLPVQYADFNYGRERRADQCRRDMDDKQRVPIAQPQWAFLHELRAREIVTPGRSNA